MFTSITNLPLYFHYYYILSEKHIEIFVAIETKLRIEKKRKIIQSFANEWNIITNHDES